jgi:hypothetical protein
LRVASAWKGLGVQAQRGVFADAQAVAQPDAALVGAGASRAERALGVLRRYRVRMLMTPLTAFAPHSVPPGPLMTSMRSTSSSSTSCTSQNTPEMQRRVDAAPVDHHEQLVGAACSFEPRAR